MGDDDRPVNKRRRTRLQAWGPLGTVQPDREGSADREFLARCHWKTIYTHLRRRGYDHEQAQDLTQGFFQEVVLERDLIGQVDPTKGPLRSFLFVALCRYLISMHRRQNSRGRIPQNRLASLDTVELSKLPQCDAKSALADTPDDAWLSETLTAVLEQIHAEYREKGMLVHWHVFQDHVLRPILDQTNRTPLKRVSERYGVDEAKATSMIVTVKRRVRRLFLQYLRKRAASDEAVKSEIEEMLQGFAPEIGQE
jgi:DNA-directed RNA polymerase specialized sigma24 family protein